MLGKEDNMCGIVGYIGKNESKNFLLKGLKNLEYRGYDSCGVATLDKSMSEKDSWKIFKSIRRVNELIKDTKDSKFSNIGIGHTRWATHGVPDISNAHPHLDSKRKFAIVHNGIIENYLELKKELLENNFTFYSDTDTEVIANLLSYFYEDNVEIAIKKATQKMRGSYALAILCVDAPDTLYAVRNKSPLLIGEKDDEFFVASDICAISEYTNQYYLLNNGEIASIRKGEIKFRDFKLNEIEKDKVIINMDKNNLELGEYPNYMKKEIFEAPITVRRTLEAYFDANRKVQLGIDDDFFKDINTITIVACGTAMHAGLAAKYTIEELTGISVNVEVASEFRYKRFILSEKTLVIFISQSGETADTIAAQEIAKKHHIKHISIVNVLNSTLARESDKVLYTKAGVEIAVASTKAYIAQVVLLNIFAINLARIKERINEEDENKFIEELYSIPSNMERILGDEETYKKYAEEIKNESNMFFIGRGIDYYAVLEGSLKLKEISYIHSEAYPAGELKHGTIALIEKGTVVVAVCTDERIIEKTISNIQEVTARGANILCITTSDIIEKNDSTKVILLPKIGRYLSIVLSVIPMQLIAYYTTVAKDLDVDKPRNLAKSVTVE